MKRARPEQKNAIVDILSQTYDNDPAVNDVIKQDEQRQDHIRGLMEYSFDICNTFGDVWISDDEQACALVLYPDKKRSTLSMIWWDIKFLFMTIGLSRLNMLAKRDSRINFFHPNKPFFYLCFIGVNSTIKNKGQDEKLLEDIIRQSVREGRPIYLETSGKQKCEWYKKFGFEMFQALDFTYPLYMLRRQPG